jgi:hypothetical protein
MCDAAFKNGIAGVSIIEMHGVAVGRDFGKKFDIAVGDGFMKMAGHANLNILNADGAAWLVVEHWPESLVALGFV